MRKVAIKNIQELPWSEVKLKANQYLPKIVFIIFAVLIVKMFAELTWDLFTDKESPVIAANNASFQADKAQVSQYSLKDVASYHLFGNAHKAAPVTQTVIEAPETRLKLDLKGVFATTDSARALAIISSNKVKDKTYHIGEKITGGAELHAVYADRVILKRNGRLETLRLPESKLDSKAVNRVQPQTRSRVQPAQQPVAAKKPTQQLKDMRDTLINDPAEIWKQVRINPVMKNGKVEGYTFSHNDQAFMTAMNLRKTDIITGINGQSLSDPATLYGLMDTLAEHQSLELTVNRNGQEQTIHLSF